ncbi:hypothetical protein G6F56_003464 [Rhizopus delemar]|uniref:Uncharacterized protein n=1 Tax=Rhizopus stolonifer TaxID=4846 RepID=A0A367KKJ6_RHIST|nr:hypothetical protein G6F56_003464 [Rhizopus delemar]RCI02753.1 hypothetical protein CU098_007583 [Rhizopus stolonifer]
MKFSYTLAIVLLVATVSASPQPWWGKGDKEINQNAGGAGNSASHGIASGALSGGVLAKNENNNNIEQNGVIN